MVQPRFLILAFPIQGVINPTLSFASRLVRVIAGAQVTFVITVHAHRLMTKSRGAKGTGSATPNDGLSFAPFSDGYDDGFPEGTGIHGRLVEFRRRGWQALADILESGLNKEGRPYTCLVYTMLLSWAADVAAEHNVPAALFWVQPATVFDIYYYYYHGYREIIRDNSKTSSFSLSFPGIKPLAMSLGDLPSFMADSGDSYFVTQFQEMYEDLEKEGNNTKIILVNTFDELEPEALRAVSKFNLIGIGPLIQSPTPTSFQSDLFQQSSQDYIGWLNTKPKTAVIYVSFGSFGSVSVLSKHQIDEIAKGLLEFGRPFLWVIREKSDQGDEEEDDELSCREELEKLGMIVPWCSQMDVLSNESVGCFVTHCGWNSTLESLASGVPMVAFPKWSDQRTNAKLIEEEWKTGVRVKPHEDGIVRSEEIRRCLELVLGGKENAVEIVRNVKKWQNLAKEAIREGGSSEKNIMSFVNRVMDMVTND
ncbi:phloretin 4'-O-glucosyltransferase-like [Humulus lupulus]|uniref:phloretin 4'-O-glucosyltransferase-like n=1 Tax=Humulus lupulus TaxID=3486 RepID=UPI002B40A99A|nr:phloretin 4'-O-glucosyltransferase-like [Humulus lupulus]